jgi:hypothetical protein
MGDMVIAQCSCGFTQRELFRGIGMETLKIARDISLY